MAEQLAEEGLAQYAVFDGLLYDITAPTHDVEVQVSPNGKVMWVNVGGTCVLRICRAASIRVISEHYELKEL